MLKQPLLYPLKLFFPLVLKTTIDFCQKSEAQNLTNSANHYEQRIITVKDNQVMFLEHLHPVTNVWACCPRVVEHWRSCRHYWDAARRDCQVIDRAPNQESTTPLKTSQM